MWKVSRLHQYFILDILFFLIFVVVKPFIVSDKYFVVSSLLVKWLTEQLWRVHVSHVLMYVCVLDKTLFTDTGPYHDPINCKVFFKFIHPKFPKFHDIPHSTVNSIFMAGFRDFIHVSYHRKPWSCWLIASALPPPGSSHHTLNEISQKIHSIRLFWPPTVQSLFTLHPTRKHYKVTTTSCIQDQNRFTSTRMIDP